MLSASSSSPNGNISTLRRLANLWDLHKGDAQALSTIIAGLGFAYGSLSYVSNSITSSHEKISLLQTELSKERELREKEVELHGKVLSSELSKERELREKELSKERELREKEVSKERELCEKELSKERELRENDRVHASELRKAMTSEFEAKGGALKSELEAIKAQLVALQKMK